MPPVSVAVFSECVECGAGWLPGDPDRWQLVEADVDELAWYCARCVECEFGDP